MKNPDGTTRIIQQSVASPIQKSNITSTNTSSDVTTTTPTTSNNSKQQQSQQVAQNSTQVTNNMSPSPAAQTPQPHKVQIIRGPDGKVSVRGLSPGQQLIQMPDGKLHVLTTTTTSSSSSPCSSTSQSKILKLNNYFSSV